MLRHLKRLAAKGWQVAIVGEAGQSTASCDAEGWPVHRLSLRKPWWPPFRPNNSLLRQIRMGLWARECAGFFHEPPSALFTYLSLYSELPAEVATHYARRCGAPLSVMVYDYPPDFPGWKKQDTAKLLRRQNWILQNADRTWFVSPELADKYDLPAAKKQVLMPIPAGDIASAQWMPSFAERPVIIYAGYIYPVQLPILAQIGRSIHEAGGRLLLLSKKTVEIEALCRTEPVDCRDLFPTNREAIEFVRTTAAGLLVSYTDKVQDMPWITTSFPSKFVEFSHTGLPTLIVAPATSAIGSWAVRNQFQDFTTSVQATLVRAFMEALKTQELWEEKAARVRELARTQFNADVIQEQFEKGLKGKS
jgi:hypothetical protein